MAVHLITYDLIDEKDYPKIFAAIKEIGEHIHPLKSVWLVSSQYTSMQIRDHLRTATDNDDKLFVCRLGETAWWNLTAAEATWIPAKIQEK